MFDIVQDSNGDALVKTLRRASGELETAATAAAKTVATGLESLEERVKPSYCSFEHKVKGWLDG
jgi:hypothetical protein